MQNYKFNSLKFLSQIMLSKSMLGMTRFIIFSISRTIPDFSNLLMGLRFGIRIVREEKEGYLILNKPKIKIYRIQY